METILIILFLALIISVIVSAIFMMNFGKDTLDSQPLDGSPVIYRNKTRRINVYDDGMGTILEIDQDYEP